MYTLQTLYTWTLLFLSIVPVLYLYVVCENSPIAEIRLSLFLNVTLGPAAFHGWWNCPLYWHESDVEDTTEQLHRIMQSTKTYNCPNRNMLLWAYIYSVIYSSECTLKKDIEGNNGSWHVRKYILSLLPPAPLPSPSINPNTMDPMLWYTSGRGQIVGPNEKVMHCSNLYRITSISL